MAKGGKRPGAGRKKGVSDKPRILDHWSPKDIEDYFDHLKASYKTDARITVFVGEHLMGKAPQPLTGEGGVGPVAVEISEAIAKKNNINV